MMIELETPVEVVQNIQKKKVGRTFRKSKNSIYIDNNYNFLELIHFLVEIEHCKQQKIHANEIMQLCNKIKIIRDRC